ncbi:putative G-type lectin S-receptor-like serine/threonine-protein kinase-like isoform X1 [Capsicum annuum]|uniref:non-specific serine/threonine protein kinase n=1 Tax=Capsicum annuum TaxID=4072 RepID=A0A2G2ZY67_CAPAN|nr:putative G-type lectin S-receptor-like serine/threonine-protein kinase-like isoform X1 [Capsicum annuum]KAF3679570.1 putative G-type lectin S-receptor-like serine/threonine-protein kinase-like isoform X1 [Capsicum annuum]PHT86932.1 hypothetical protein T459_09038 [Capsicum annuum]
MTLKECRKVCSRNCSCTAYSSLDISYGDQGCLLWYGELIDIRKLPERGIDIFIKMDPSEQKLKFRDDIEFPLLLFSTIERSTKNFLFNQKIGEGGVGPIFKGVLEEGQEIAIKRLSRTSMQGLDEYKNKVIYISKLQHQNPMRLLGCCIQGEEKMLIYEYMPNKSLDLYIFDKTKSKLLDWPKWFDIINGIAHRLSYLHQDSQLRIIHRDHKASNILLDKDIRLWHG